MDKKMIEVHSLSKQYRLGVIGASSLKADLQRWTHKIRKAKYADADPYKIIEQKEESRYVWALRDVEFSVKQGEAVGFVGGNGAGKSTLLKILSRITEPTHGEAVLRGRVASLLEVGTGMHPDLTGRENIFLNAAILGMPREVTKRKLDDIIDFSGVSQFIDTPVKRYSSGMRVRLAFSVAAFLDADILIADEVLAVGDADFQKKCIGKMGEVAHGGRTVLFVSHDLAAVQNLCTRVIALRKGQVIADAAPAEAIQTYLQQAAQSAPTRTKDARNEGPHLVSASVSQGPNTLQNLLTAGKPAYFSFRMESMLPGTFCVMEIYNENATLVTRFGSEKSNLGPISGDGVLTCVMDPLRMSPGRYRLAASIYVNDFHYEYIEHVADFEVNPGWVDGFRVENPRWNGLVKLPHRWHLNGVTEQQPA